MVLSLTIWNIGFGFMSKLNSVVNITLGEFYLCLLISYTYQNDEAVVVFFSLAYFLFLHISFQTSTTRMWVDQSDNCSPYNAKSREKTPCQHLQLKYNCV